MTNLTVAEVYAIGLPIIYGMIALEAAFSALTNKSFYRKIFLTKVKKGYEKGGRGSIYEVRSRFTLALSNCIKFFSRLS